MEPILLIAVLAIVGGGAWYVMGRSRTAGASDATPGSPGQTTVTPTPAGGLTLETNLQALKPGDAVSFWDGTDVIVRGSFDCREELGGRTTSWRWVFLSGDRILELLPQGQTSYDGSSDGSAVARQGDEFYELLVGAGGALKRFEANVREGIAHEPVEVVIDDVTYRIRSTGTFSARRVGELPEAAEVWADVSENPGDNVYFKMVPVEDGDANVALGIWTTHILILTGHPLDRSEITGVYAT